MKRVLLIDPWGIKSTGDYTRGLIHGLSTLTSLSVVTNYYFDDKGETGYRLFKIFFKRSENMKQSKFRSIIRGIEYYTGYNRILKMCQNENYDIVHINWLLFYKLDIFMLKKLKEYGIKIVYTAHNVLPHVSGRKNKEELKEIYSLVDRIIVHGEMVKKEFYREFPEYSAKIYVQKHGANLSSNTCYNINEIDSKIREKVEAFPRKFIFFGNIFYNKGVDILLRKWLYDFSQTKVLLIVAGKKRENYLELDELEEKSLLANNILYLNKFVDDNMLNYLINQSEIILLPYRHASMSGVVFTASDFRKPILCINAGAICITYSFILYIYHKILTKNHLLRVLQM